MKVIDPVPALEQLLATTDELLRTGFAFPVLRRLRAATQAFIEDFRGSVEDQWQYVRRIRARGEQLVAVAQQTATLPDHVRQRLNPAIAEAGRAVSGCGQGLSRHGHEKMGSRAPNVN